MSCSNDNTILLWDARSGELLRTLVSYTRAVFAYSFTCLAKFRLQAAVFLRITPRFYPALGMEPCACGALMAVESRFFMVTLMLLKTIVSFSYELGTGLLFFT